MYQHRYDFIPEKWQNVQNQLEEFSRYVCEQEGEQKDPQQLMSLYWPSMSFPASIAATVG